MEEDKEIKIIGDDNKVEIEEGGKVEIKRDDNIVEVRDDIKIKDRIPEIKKGFSQTINFLKQKKTINVIIIVLLILILIGSSWMRLQNLPLLKDVTTGEYIPLALDPFYFLRVAETMISGDLPAYDAMRYPSLKLSFTHEIMPQTTIILYKIINVFSSEVTLQFADVISPVIFFVLGIIAFFFLIFVLTRSKEIALLSSFFLAIIPTYLYRTLAGFADHESIGMFALFLTFLVYAVSIKFLDKKSSEPKDKRLIKTGLLALLVAFVSAFSMAAWGGGGKFIFMIIPLSFVLIWLIKVKRLEDHEIKKSLKNYFLFYIVWFISTILFMKIYGDSFYSIINKVTLNSSIVNSAVLLFLIVDYVLILKKGKILKRNLEKHRVLISALITFVIGIIFLIFLKKDVFGIIIGIFASLIDPFGGGRIGSTVAENAPPYISNWISQIGKVFFWVFYLGMIFVGVNLSKGIRKNKNKILFSVLWILMISGILFSRISSGALLNGDNFISKALYFTSLFLFLGYSVWLYFNDKIKIDSGLIIIATWLFFMLVSGRGAIRLFFLVTPFICFMVGYAIVMLFNYARKSKDELWRILLFILLILIIIGLVMGSINFINSSKNQAKYTGPSANYHWQKAMFWVRENTAPGGIFVHWWDYGYWVQYLGKRSTITDGGHGNDYWDHLIGRYVLTTQRPETALSFMKAHNVSYLLIDPSDIGKYPAYSRIGSNTDYTDRYAVIPTVGLDASQTQETSNTEIRVYPGGVPVDEDIIFNQNGNQTFLPAQSANYVGTILEIDKASERISQATGIFYYNNQQFRIPLRYIYYEGQITDFQKGLEAGVYVIPSLTQSGQGVNIEKTGAIIYLSPRVFPSLVSQLYLLDDPFNRYNGVELIHAEPSPVVSGLMSQGLSLNEFVYYQGLQGPIKIWEINPPSNIIAREEFLQRTGEFAGYDDLQFITQ